MKEKKEMEETKKILVVGSLNMDCVIETPQMPLKGETVSGTSVTMIPGGKGANQAFAAGKLGGSVAMIGAVGKDAAGKALKESLESVGVDVSSVEEMEGETTGQAFITVDEKGENSIIIIEGANRFVTKELVENNVDKIRDSRIVIMQLEIPMEAVKHTKNYAKKLGKTVIVDPAPVCGNIPDDFWEGIDYIKPNETELAALTGRMMKTKEELREGAMELISKGVKGVIVTLGKEGCLYVTKEEAVFFSAKQVKAVDTTAAGDGFTAAFALALSRGKSCREAIAFGQKVSAITVTRKGAQTSVPAKEEVEQYADMESKEEKHE